MVDQPSKNSDITQKTTVNLQKKKNLSLKTQGNTPLLKQKLSHNTETTNSTDLNTSVMKTSNIDITEKSLTKQKKIYLITQAK